MANRRQLKVEEKIRLMELYQDSKDTMQEFCDKHGLSRTSLYRILKDYGGQPVEQSLSEAEHIQREKELQLEILKLKIENERLKKNYTVRITEDGKTEYIRLRARNLKS